MPSARSIRKKKEKANKKKRRAAGDVLNPYAQLEDDATDDETEVERDEEVSGTDADGTTEDGGRPKTSGSDTSGKTLVGAQQNLTETSTPALTPPRTNTAESEKQGPKIISSEWTYDDLSEFDTPDYLEHPDEPLTEAEIKHKEIEDWLGEQTGHHYHLKRSTAEKIVDFVYGMKYEEDRAEWMKEVRLIVWRAAVRANFWWTNPDTKEPPGRPVPISAPTGPYEHSFHIFVACAAERLDRIGRDLPDPEYVQQIEGALRLFFRRIDYKKLTRPLEHLAFLLLIDEEQNRYLTREAMQGRLKMCFDGMKGMEWGGLGIVRMGNWPTRKSEPPLRTDVMWQEVLKRFEL